MLVKQQLDLNNRFTNVAVVPSGNHLLFATGPVFDTDVLVSGIGVFNVSTSNFLEHSSLKINYHNGTLELSPRYEFIRIFNTNNNDLKNTSYEIMIGGRVDYDNDLTKDTFLLYYGAFHGKNATIEITHYQKFNQGTHSSTQTTEASLECYSESGFLNILEDPTTSSNAISLIKFTESIATNSIYEVNLMSFYRNFTQINWMTRYQENYQAEAQVHNSKIYLVLTKNSNLYIQIINITSGSAITKVHYTLGNNEKLYYPQMDISDKYSTMFLVHKVINASTTPTPSEDNQMRISLFNTTDLSLKSESFTYSQQATPYSIDVLQVNNSEQVVVKGILDTIVDNSENRFTFSFFPLINTQDYSTCSATGSLSLTTAVGDPVTVSESILTGYFSSTISNMRWKNSGITYVASPIALTPTSLCSTTDITPKEIVGTSKTYRTQNYTLVTVPITSTSPTGLSMTYELIAPTEYAVNITSNSTSVSFNFSGEYDLNYTIELQYIARVNASLYTSNNYSVTVACRDECSYCSNDTACIICAKGSEGFCESYADSNDKTLMYALSAVIQILVSLLVLRSI